jgi:arsenite methyltransferase
VTTTNPVSPAEALREQVRERYAAAARQATTGTHATDSDCGCGQPAGCGCDDACCGTGATAEPGFGADLYTAGEQGELPETALLASLGCGNPTAVADLREGETVLDLGSGGGIDVLLSARRVGPTGQAYGLDMTEEMLALARRNAAQAGAANVTFLKGHIEQIPLPEATVDVVISNCVINLSVDKPAVFAEIHRVLKPGGRAGVSDVVAEDSLTPADRAERGSYVGCIAGALSRSEYEQGLAAAGFEQVQVTFTHQVADGLHSAIIRATKPATPAVHEAGISTLATGLPVVDHDDCCTSPALTVHDRGAAGGPPPASEIAQRRGGARNHADRGQMQVIGPAQPRQDKRLFHNPM